MGRAAVVRAYLCLDPTFGGGSRSCAGVCCAVEFADGNLVVSHHGVGASKAVTKSSLNSHVLQSTANALGRGDAAMTMSSYPFQVQLEMHLCTNCTGAQLPMAKVMALEELEIRDLDQVTRIYAALLSAHVRLLKLLMPRVMWKEVPVVVVFEQNTS
ncbi:hypothetical protein DPEC_G00069020 [Dallia pectoralis]|uniref:Uncharacterized protein n=1 Tax=Dallia pectoralis TaxID=75939 RepID=A0ACC2H2K0_DALPE|nr:hypothetical protein DPEC_G00069020 [Dallia pectoralis]